MDWLSENWVFLLVVIAMMAMHLFGHGGHGGHGGGRHRDPDDERKDQPDEAGSRPGHRH